MSAQGIVGISVIGFLIFLIFCIYFIFKQIEFILVSVNLYKEMVNKQETTNTKLQNLHKLIEGNLSVFKKDTGNDEHNKKSSESSNKSEVMINNVEEEEINKKIDNMLEFGIAVNNKTYFDIEEAKKDIAWLKNEIKETNNFISDNEKVRLKCIDNNMSYDDIVGKCQSDLTGIRKKIGDIKKSFEPIKL